MVTTVTAAKPSKGYSILLSSACKPKSGLVGDMEAGVRAQAWVGQVINEQLEGGFADAFRNGQALCHLINTIRPGTIKKIDKSTLPFKEMANISSFLRGCRELGVPEHALFETLDLYNEKRLPQVTRCLYSLSETARKTMPEFNGPFLCSPDRPGVDTVVKASGHSGKDNQPTACWTKPTSPNEAPSEGAHEVRLDSQRSVIRASSLNVEVNPGELHSPSAAAQATGHLALETLEETPVVTPLESPEDRDVPVASAACGSSTGRERGSVGGVSSTSEEPRSSRREDELRSREEAAARADAQMEVALWIEGVTGVTFPGKFWPSLRDGVLLCKLIDAIQPGLIPRIERAGAPAAELANIKSFLLACHILGVAAESLFDERDLHEKRDLEAVVHCLGVLSETLESSSSFRGPFLGQRSKTRQSLNARGLRKQLGKGPGAKGGIDLAGLGCSADPGRAIVSVKGKFPDMKDDVTAVITPAESASGKARVSTGADTNITKSGRSPAPVNPSLDKGAGQRECFRRKGLLSGVATPLRSASPLRAMYGRYAVQSTDGVILKAGPPSAAKQEDEETADSRWKVPAPRGSGAARGRGDGEEGNAGGQDTVREVQSFMESRTRMAWRVDGDLYESLRDGWQLVLLANSFRPGAIRRVHNSIIPAKHVQNIGNFLTACRRMGVPRHLIFEVPDLYAKRDLGRVAKTVLALRSLASDAGFARAMRKASSSMESSLINSAVMKAAAAAAAVVAAEPCVAASSERAS